MQVGNMEEKNLIKQLANNNGHSFRLLYEKYHHKIFRVAFSLGMTHDEAIELVQDVFVIIWERRNLLLNVNSLEAYIIAITKNITFKKLRKKAFEHAHKIYFSDEQHQLTVLPELEIETEEIHMISASALNLLSPLQKQIFTLFTQDNMTHQQIATKCNLSVRAVENHIYRSRKILKDYLKMGLMIAAAFF